MADTYPINTGTKQGAYVPAFSPVRDVNEGIHTSPYITSPASKYNQQAASNFKANLINTDYLNVDPVGTNSVLKNEGSPPTPKPGMFDNILSDEFKMGNLTGLASTLMQAAALPSMMRAAKIQNQTAQHNLDTGKAEQARRNKNISGFNAPRANQSAFV